MVFYVPSLQFIIFSYQFLLQQWKVIASSELLSTVSAVNSTQKYRLGLWKFECDIESKRISVECIDCDVWAMIEQTFCVSTSAKRHIQNNLSIAT